MPEANPADGLVGFQAMIPWEGTEVLTLTDLPPEQGGTVLIGINPSPVSVEVGHYYQGTLGKRLWSRLAKARLLELSSPWEDERWREAGNGLSDVVKRPTSAAKDVTKSEMEVGAELLRVKLAAWKPALILFPFLASAEAVLGSAPPVGLGPAIGGIPTFRMAGPYAASEDVEENVRDLRELLGKSGPAAEPDAT